MQTTVMASPLRTTFGVVCYLIKRKTSHMVQVSGPHSPTGILCEEGISRPSVLVHLSSGTSCHISCMKVTSLSYPTLSDPMDCSLPGSSVHGIFQARVLEWVATSFSRGSSRSSIEPGSPALQTDTLLSEPPGKPPILNESLKSSKSPFPIKRRLYFYMVLSESGLAPHCCCCC